MKNSLDPPEFTNYERELLEAWDESNIPETDKTFEARLLAAYNKEEETSLRAIEAFDTAICMQMAADAREDAINEKVMREQTILSITGHPRKLRMVATIAASSTLSALTAVIGTYFYLHNGNRYVETPRQKISISHAHAHAEASSAAPPGLEESHVITPGKFDYSAALPSTDTHVEHGTKKDNSDHLTALSLKNAHVKRGTKDDDLDHSAAPPQDAHVEHHGSNHIRAHDESTTVAAIGTYSYLFRSSIQETREAANRSMDARISLVSSEMESTDARISLVSSNMEEMIARRGRTDAAFVESHSMPSGAGDLNHFSFDLFAKSGPPDAALQGSQPKEMCPPSFDRINISKMARPQYSASLFVLALDIQEKALGPMHPDVAKASVTSPGSAEESTRMPSCCTCEH